MPGNKKVQITNTKHVLLKKKNPLFAKKNLPFAQQLHIFLIFYSHI